MEGKLRKIISPSWKIAFWEITRTTVYIKDAILPFLLIECILKCTFWHQVKDAYKIFSYLLKGTQLIDDMLLVPL